ncbi:Predicted phosphodiesterase [Jatrophihabitans endophyticus]|uniref:Predicted phosphodiesterase n=1 Tax=Jatrophihabitans endophyticus TaxID=1206085 RepID=A0A1M5LWB6_9ACTN|nr:metallophosphoesterase family protein [Jatrophihabitans endophyticus]SHG68929.1 Predicted phosphodiesterase [Jatrophihabitans endophyticus]
MTVAVLSDVHGVLPALEAVLAEAAVRAAELIVVTGDISAGPQPVEVLDRLLAEGERVVLVRGNADRELVALVDGGETRIPDPIAPWAAARLAARPDLVTLLRGLPHPLVRDVPGFGAVLFCHGSPRDDDEVVLVDTRPERWAEAFADVADDVRTVVCGHTHMPFLRLVDRRTVVNPGSVGMPYGGSGAHWALLHDGAVTLCRSAFDVAAARDRIAAGCDYPDVAEWTDYYLHSRASDLEALRVFGPRDGRVSAAGRPAGG